VYKLRAAEADFDLFGMNVDVHFVVRHFEKEQCRRREWRADGCCDKASWMACRISLSRTRRLFTKDVDALLLVR
jgi:hypothetical protein